MKIVRVHFSTCILAFDDVRAPVLHRFHDPDVGLTIEVRTLDGQAYVYGRVERDGITRYAGQHNGQWAHSPSALTGVISAEMLRLAEELEVGKHHVWPFIEQLPLFTPEGVDVADALALADPIKDLIARGAPINEVIGSLQIERQTVEFVLGVKMPEARPSAILNDATSW